jgi:nitrogen fixation NifU-like protein
VLFEQLVGQNVQEALATVDAFNQMMTSRGTVDGDEEVIGDGIAFAGVSKYPARVKCALLGWMAFKDALAQTVVNREAPADNNNSARESA